MTEVIGNIVIIKEELPQQCDLCGKVAELRPYGPKGECICYECGMKNKPTTTERAIERMFGDG